MIYRFSIVLLTLFNMQVPEKINWQSKEEVTTRIQKEFRPVILLYSADWCRGCVSLKQTLNKHAKQLNKNAYFVYVDCTDGSVDEVELYPTMFIFNGNGNEIKIIGNINEDKIKVLLELN